jgi:drug/metabolite transporter (DMT)-like permease
MQMRDFGLLTVLGAVWGASYLFLRVATPVVGPFVVSGLRVLIAGLVLLGYSLLLHRPPKLWTRWRSLLLLATFNSVLPFVLISWSTVNLNASIASILNAMTPIFTALVAAVWMKEQLGWRKGLGLLLGVSGVVVLMGWSPLGLNARVLLGVAGSLAGALCYGIGGVYARVGFQGLPSLDMAIGQQLAASVLLVPLATITWRPHAWSFSVLAALIGLSLISTAFAYLIYFDLMARVGPTNTLSVTFLVPVFGTLWGVIFLHEPLRLSLIAGLLIILTGVFLVTGVRIALREGVTR